MDEDHLGAALRYVALNPVRARLVKRPQDWRWSSVHAHLGGASDGITAVGPVAARYPDFAALIDAGPDIEAFARLRRAETIGRPVGSEAFLEQIEDLTGRTLKPQKRGPKPGLRRVDYGLCSMPAVTAEVCPGSVR
jgi:putative transposase